MREEINLTTLFVLIAKSIKSNFLFIVVLLLVGGSTGMGFYFFKSPVYKSEAVFESSLLSLSEIKTLIIQFNESLRNGEQNENYSNWINIDYKTPEDVPSPIVRGDEFKKNYITLKLTSDSKAIFESAALEIESYFSNTPSIQSFQKTSTKALTDYSNRLQKRIDNDDKLLEGKSAYSIQEFNLESNVVLDELTYVNLALEDLSIFKVVKPFYTPIERSESKLLYILIGGIVFLLVGIVVKAIWNA